MADMTLFFVDNGRLFTVALGQRKRSKYFEQKHCFRDLMFFSADSENMKNISSDFLWICADQGWKIQRCFRENQLWINAVQRWFS